MNLNCGSDRFFKLLDNNILDYTLYKEPDLVFDDDKLIISTIHKAKGLEFTNVIIPQCTAQLKN